MLTKTAIAAAAPIAQLYAGRDFYFEPKDGSSLAGLVRIAATPLAQREDMQTATLTEFAGILNQASMVQNLEGQHEHDAAMEEMRNVVTGAIRFNIQLARETVNPQLESIVNGLDELYREVEAATVNRFKIVPSATSPALESGLFEELAERFAETRSERVVFDVQIPRPENMAPYLTTGNLTYDQALTETAEALGPDAVGSIWDRLFIAGDSSIDQLFPINNRRSWGELVLAYVMVKNVQQNLPDGVKAPIERVQQFLNDLAVQLGRLIAVAGRQRSQQERSERVILSAPQGDAGEVIVNADVYNNYIEKGGTPEAVLGAVNSHESLVTAPELVEQKPRLERQWNAARRIRQETLNANRYSATVDHVRAEIARIIVAQVDEAVRPALFERLEMHLKTMTSRVLDDTWSVIRSVLCGVLYHHTAVETILRGIDDESANNPGVSVEEAALLACVDYYVDWIAGQTNKLKKVA